MPRLMMSRPWAARAVARARTAKAFSSPMRSKFATVFMERPEPIFGAHIKPAARGFQCPAQQPQKAGLAQIPLVAQMLDDGLGMGLGRAIDRIDGQFGLLRRFIGTVDAG